MSDRLLPYHRVAWRGFKLGYGLAVTYSLLFELIAIAATSWEIQSRLGWGEGAAGAIGASALSFCISVTALALLFSLLPGVLVMLAFLFTRGLLPLAAEGLTPRRISTVAVFVTVGLLFLVNLVAWQAGGTFFVQLGWSGYLFWFGLPGILFVTAVARTAPTLITRK